MQASFLLPIRIALQQHFVPLANRPVLNDTIQHKRVSRNEFFGGFACPKHAHRTLARIGERANRKKGPVAQVLLTTRAVLVYVERRLRHNIVGRLINNHIFHENCPLTTPLVGYFGNQYQSQMARLPSAPLGHG